MKRAPMERLKALVGRVQKHANDCGFFLQLFGY